MKTSNFLSLNLRDIAKGLLMAILTPVVVIVQQSIESGTFTFDWKSIGVAALGGGVAYLIKNFFTSNKPQGIASDEADAIISPKPPTKPQ